MNLPSISYLLTASLLIPACQSTDKPNNNTAGKETVIDTILIAEARLNEGTRFNPTDQAITRDDVKSFTGNEPEKPVYKADTLAATDKVFAVLFSRLYSNETIGWLVTFNRSTQQQLDKLQVYYDNAEGMTQTETRWLPQQQQAIVKTETYEEEGQPKITTLIYQLMPDGKLRQATPNTNK
ncbi:hypothetical protein [Spirosoma endbachense]|uniref:Uncharacterized protein n=1 Tax=Spirosoma endbachense TaxID=2666025 RepID=A0A6P1W8A6_9BACT|nr:hypothetical protein [Spirosoma endbachense]QHW00799.1 hypothetical protein GJR95_39795 [Spirosoma endbachense]